MAQMRREAFYRFNPEIERSDLSDKCDTVLIKKGFLIAKYAALIRLKNRLCGKRKAYGYFID